MTPTTTTTSGAADLPEALTVAVDCWFAKNTGLGGCSDKDVRELADIFRLHALAAGQATAAPAQPVAQQGVAYAALPESFLEIPDVQDESGINAYYSREVVLECIDAALASHGQAPALTNLNCKSEQKRLATLWGFVPAQAASVQEDAARYRWLREGNDAKHGAAWHVAVNLYGCEWDAAIDAAIKQGATT